VYYHGAPPIYRDRSRLPPDLGLIRVDSSAFVRRLGSALWGLCGLLSRLLNVRRNSGAWVGSGFMSEDTPSTISIAVRSAPFARDPPYAIDFYEAIGRIVVLWGRLEMHLDAVLQMTLNIARLHGIDEPMAVALKRKTELFRRVCSQCSVLSDRSEVVTKLMNDINETGDDRNKLIHSNVNDFDDGPPPRLILKNISYRHGNIVIRTITPSMDELGALAANIDALNNRIFGATSGWTLLQDRRIFERAVRRGQSEGGSTPPNRE
jgi:hypothetical protein